MIEHLKDLTDRALKNEHEGCSSLYIAKEMYQELRRLDPLDFEQAKRADFNVVRDQFDSIANPLPHKSITGAMITSAFSALRPILAFYRGQGSYSYHH